MLGIFAIPVILSVALIFIIFHLSSIIRKPDFCICENKGTDQLCSNHTSDQRLCFHHIDSMIPLLPKTKFQASNHLLWLYSPVCVGHGRKLRRLVFSQCGSSSSTILMTAKGIPVNHRFMLQKKAYVRLSKCKLTAKPYQGFDNFTHV